ncbi:glycosyltransferase [Nocardia sp. CDC160]|uniref:glycosyltransferase n=1 Tax=Nocardia sp. CDC160 TaxID=3112166 RepID=UPI002DB730CB|nr:glycosyltransferase [Nocardia sp. CDC160]MEC3918663.1 glycosyltransferase [Nocardia sp. CDC160]
MSAARIAIVHERFTEYGGSEAVVAEFIKTWPGAPVFAPIADAPCTRALLTAAGLEVSEEGDSTEIPAAAAHLVRDSWLSRAYAASGRRSHAPLLPLVPRVLRGLPLRDEFDAVVVSHHAFATQAALATDAPVIAYVHSPARWAWDRAFRAREAGGVAGQAALTALGVMARRNELRAAPRLAHVVANSQAVADRVRDWWGLPASVVNPPVRVERFAPDPRVEREDFFLFAGRLVPYKRPDLAIRAARQAGVRLVILGDGRYRRQLESMAGPETVFLGAASDEVLQDMYRRCRALLMPGVEDFGIVPVEAMACGAPVLAVGEGGALDTVVPGISGEHVPAGSDDSVVAGFARLMRDFDPSAYHAETIRKHAATFSPESFRTRIADIVSRHSR